MKATILATTLAALALGGCGATSSLAERHVVYGVGEDDMLKLRGGPGTGFEQHAGLPNGTVVRVLDCTSTGGTSWCEVALDRSPGMRGYVSQAYLRRL